MTITREEVAEIASSVVSRIREAESKKPESKFSQTVMVVFLLVLGWLGATTYKTSLDIAVLKGSVSSLAEDISDVSDDRYRGADASRDKAEIMGLISRLQARVDKQEDRLDAVERSK